MLLTLSVSVMKHKECDLEWEAKKNNQDNEYEHPILIFLSIFCKLTYMPSDLRNKQETEES